MAISAAEGVAGQMVRRALTVLLATLMLAGLGQAAWAAQDGSFVDVPEGHWAYEAIANLAAAGLVEGYPDGTFGGARTITRYEAAMIFSRMLSRLENVVKQDVAGEVEGLSAQVAGDVSQRVLARATAEIQQSITAAREALAQELDRMVTEKLAQVPPTERVTQRVIVEKQPQVVEKETVYRPFEVTDEVRAAIAAVVADQVKQELSPERIRQMAADLASSEEVTGAIDAAIEAKLGPILGLRGLDADVAALRGDVDAIRAVLNRRVEELTSAIAVLQERVGTLEGQVAVATDTENALAQQIAAVDHRVAGLEATTAEEFATVSQRVASLEQAQAQKAAQSDVEDLTKRVQSLQTANTRLTWALVVVGLAAVAGIFVK